MTFLTGPAAWSSASDTNRTERAQSVLAHDPNRNTPRSVPFCATLSHTHVRAHRTYSPGRALSMILCCLSVLQFGPAPSDLEMPPPYDGRQELYVEQNNPTLGLSILLSLLTLSLPPTCLPSVSVLHPGGSRREDDRSGAGLDWNSRTSTTSYPEYE